MARRMFLNSFPGNIGCHTTRCLALRRRRATWRCGPHCPAPANCRRRTINPGSGMVVARRRTVAPRGERFPEKQRAKTYSPRACTTTIPGSTLSHSLFQAPGPAYGHVPRPSRRARELAAFAFDVVLVAVEGTRLPGLFHASTRKPRLIHPDFMRARYDRRSGVLESVGSNLSPMVQLPLYRHSWYRRGAPLSETYTR